VSAWTPIVRTPVNRPDTDCGFRKRQRTARASAVSGWTAADPQPPLRRDGSAAHVASARLCWSSGPGRRGRRRAAVRTRGHRPRPAGHRAPARPRHCGHPRPRHGMRTLRQRPRWTAGCSTVHHRSHVRPERDRHVRHRPARPPDRQIRRLALGVDLVGPRRICPAQVGCLVDPGGSRRIPSDRLDDHVPSDGKSQGKRASMCWGSRPTRKGLSSGSSSRLSWSGFSSEPGWMTVAAHAAVAGLGTVRRSAKVCRASGTTR
jgi:hypothetical protein